MTKPILITTILLFGIAAFPFLTPLSLKAEESPDSSQSAPIVQYDLAFPGILPDHPLYKLKVLRDKIIERSIVYPQKKIEFYLRQADKGVLATAMLVDKNKFDLARVTAFKAEHNMTLLVPYLHKIPERPSQVLIEQLVTASKKHQEVLLRLSTRVSQNYAESLAQVYDFSTRNLDKIILYRNDPETE